MPYRTIHPYEQSTSDRSEPLRRCLRHLLVWLLFMAVPSLAWSASPIVEWRMDEVGWSGAPTTVTNAASNRYHGTWVNPSVNPPTLSPVLPGSPGTCGYGQFSPTSYIHGDAPDLGLTEQLTVMAWIRWDIDPATGVPRATILSNNSTTAPNDGQFWLQHSSNNGDYEFRIKTTDGLQSVSANAGPKPVLGQWQHLAGVYDGATLTLYVDGVPNWSIVHTGRFLYQETYVLQVGRWAHNSESYRAFQGAIDEVRIYNTALTALEIQQAMSQERPCAAGLLARLAPAPRPALDVRMDERLWRSTTEPVIDSSDGHFNGIAMDGAAVALDAPALPGPQGTCSYGNFNGTAAYVDFGTPNLGLTGQLAAMAWVRWEIDPRTGNPWATIVTNNRAARAEQGQFWLQHNSDNSRFEFVIQTSSGKKRLLSTTQPAQGVWYHVAGVYDGRNIMVFVNGKLENVGSHAGAFTASSDDRLTVARWANASQNFRAFQGSIDEVRLYRQGLSSMAIARAVAAARTCPTAPLATPPQLDVASHAPGTGVLPSGLTLSGTVSDAAYDLVRLVITIDDPILGRTVSQQTVRINPDGTWTFVITPDLVSPGKTVTVTLTASDAQQVSTTRTFQLQVAPEPLAHWHLDITPAWSGATGEVADASGSQFHGRAINGATNVTAAPALAGDPGSCGYGDFNGTSHYLDLGNPNFGLAKKLTVMAWVRWAIDPAAGNSRATILANNRPTESDKGQFWLHHKSDNSGFTFAVQTTLGRQEIRSNTVPQQGVWYHVAGVYDGNWLRMFVNGVEERSIAHGGTLSFDPVGRLTIGRSAYSGSAYRAFRGSIDEVQVYREVMSGAQITAVANARHRCAPDAASGPPVLTITSHADGDGVPPGGFTLTGVVSDNGAPVHAYVDIDDPVLGQTVSNREASVDAAGRWRLVVGTSEITPNRDITVAVRATDSDNQETRLRIRLAVVPLPQALWHLEASQQWHGTPGEVVDASGHGYNGRAIHGALALADTPAVGNASTGTCGYASFDGVQQYIDLGNPDLRLTDQVTVMAWARWDIDPASGNSRATLVSNNSSTVANVGQFWLRHNVENTRFEFAVQTSVGLLSVASNTQPQAGRWYHVAGVYDGQTLGIAVNGVEERRTAHSGTFTYNAAYRLQLGRWAQTSQNYRAFAGSLDEVHIYKTPLTASEIRAVAYERRPCPAAPPVTLSLDTESLQPTMQDNGVLLSGSVSSGYSLTNVQVRLSNPSTGRTLIQYTVELTPDGRWAVLVDSGLLAAGQTVGVEVIATDGAGRTVRRSSSFTVTPFDRQSRQFINRTTFGATPALLDEVATLGTSQFLEQQLAPHTLDDSAFEASIAGFEPLTASELQRYLLQHAIHSRRQLREVMTWFWDNHFNTDLDKHDVVAYELAENRAFRANALGRFRDLLGISAQSPAMLVYLDNIVSSKRLPNENYARELLELHTLGVNGGYTQTDVEQVAKAFTGWRVNNGAFLFDLSRHNTDAKTVLGQVIPSGGIDEGEAILDLLAHHPSTARFLCTKLAAVFVSDTPPATLVQRCADKFLQTTAAPDQIAQMIRLLLTAPEFTQARHYRAKIKTPLEFVAGMMRHVQANIRGNDLAVALEAMGQNLFRYPTPTGFAETGTYWLNTYQMVERIKFVNRIAFNAPADSRTHIDPIAFFTAHGRDTAEGIVHFLCTLVFGDEYTELEWTTALDILTENGTKVFDITAPDADAQLRRLIGTVFSYPGYLYQ